MDSNMRTCVKVRTCKEEAWVRNEWNETPAQHAENSPVLNRCHGEAWPSRKEQCTEKNAHPHPQTRMVLYVSCCEKEPQRLDSVLAKYPRCCSCVWQ